MERTNGKMTSTSTEVGGESTGFAFSIYNYHLYDFMKVRTKKNTIDRRSNARALWPMVETVKECVESFETLITKRKLTI